MHRIHRRLAAKSHQLDYLFWECTLRCNLECRHCGSDCTSTSFVQDPPLQDFLGVLDQVADAQDPSKVTVVLTGGEPLLRPDLDVCGKAFHERGFPWGMVSNAMALTPARMERLLASGMHSLTVSLDGLAAAHNWLRGDQRSFTRATLAIADAARIPELAFDVVTCVNQRNIDDLPLLHQLLSSWRLKRWRLFTIFPRGRGADDLDLRLDRAQLRSLMDFIARKNLEGPMVVSFGCEGFLGPWEGRARDGLFFCRAGVTVGSVLADGSISACPSMRSDFVQGNIATDRFMDVWENRFQVMRDRSWTRERVPCSDCDVHRYCEGSGLHLWEGDRRELMCCHFRELVEF